MVTKQDRKLYRELSAPHESIDGLNKAVTDFYAGVAELRKQFRLANVHVLVGDSYILDGEEIDGMSSLHLGDNRKALEMLAVAFGEAKQRHHDAVGLMATSQRGNLK